jgi:hypothetical protein
MRNLLLGAMVIALVGAATTDARPLATVTLGSKRFYSPESTGFGTVRPVMIFNGGDPSGLVTKIHWSSWGGPVATGQGLNAIFKPQGGYYPHLVRIDLTARDRGRCPGSSRLAYRQLVVRAPTRPGGPLGAPFLWSGAHSLCASGP